MAPLREEDSAARPAHLFLCLENGHYAVSVDAEGANLPTEGCLSGWQFIRTFRLGVQHPGPMNVDPEAIIRGLVDRGYHLLVGDGRPHGTSQ